MDKSLSLNNDRGLTFRHTLEPADRCSEFSLCSHTTTVAQNWSNSPVNAKGARRAAAVASLGTHVACHCPKPCLRWEVSSAHDIKAHFREKLP